MLLTALHGSAAAKQRTRQMKRQIPYLPISRAFDAQLDKDLPQLLRLLCMPLADPCSEESVNSTMPEERRSACPTVGGEYVDPIAPEDRSGACPTVGGEKCVDPIAPEERRSACPTVGGEMLGSNNSRGTQWSVSNGGRRKAWIEHVHRAMIENNARGTQWRVSNGGS